MITERVFKRSNDLLSNTQSTKIIFNALEGNYALCLLGKLKLCSPIIIYVLLSSITIVTFDYYLELYILNPLFFITNKWIAIKVQEWITNANNEKRKFIYFINYIL